jgi:hypothetical protein
MGVDAEAGLVSALQASLESMIGRPLDLLDKAAIYRAGNRSYLVRPQVVMKPDAAVGPRQRSVAVCALVMRTAVQPDAPQPDRWESGGGLPSP